MFRRSFKQLTNADYPAYELYTDVLRKGIYPEKGRQLRLIVGKDRRVKEVIRL
jgi:D-glycerate 3-kinase